MSVEGIKISLGEVKSTANSLRTLNKNLNDRLIETKKHMDDLAQTWQSDASNTIRSKFNSLMPKFNGYFEVVDSYSKFLDNVVTNYDAVETSINNNASAFK